MKNIEVRGFTAVTSTNMQLQENLKSINLGKINFKMPSFNQSKHKNLNSLI